MTEQQIKKIISQGEGITVEFKEAKKFAPKSIYETIISFSNTDGGTVLLGVADNGVVLGVDNDSLVKIQKEIITALNSRDLINPPIYLMPSVVVFEEVHLIVLEVPACSQVHYYKGQIYIREFDCDINITNNQTRISDLYIRKKNFFTESEIYPHIKLSDFNKSLFVKARQLIRNYRSDHPWLLVSDEQMLKDSILWRKDYQTGLEGYTLAAVLIFGEETLIQNILPAYKLEAMVRITNADRWDDRLTLRKNLIDTYLELKLFINRYLPEKFYTEGYQRIDLRDKIFREILGNVIVHREYKSALSTELIITKTEVRVTNPNNPIFHGIIDTESFNPFPKNPNIRKYFTSFGWTDEIGSGIRNTNKYLPLYVEGAKPVFEENDVFITKIPLVFVRFSMILDEWHKWLNLPADCYKHLEKGFNKIPLPVYLIGKNWKDIIFELVPSWHKKGTQLALLDWPKNQEFDIEIIKKVPSYVADGTQLLRKKAWYLICILSLCTEPIKSSELLGCFNYKNAKNFRENYLNPLKELKLIALSKPENPTHPENKYKITEAGISFLLENIKFN